MTHVRRMTLVVALALCAAPLAAAPLPAVPVEAREELAAFARKVLSGEVTAVSPVELMKMHASLRAPTPEHLFVTIFRDRAPGIRFSAQKLGLAEATFAAMGKARSLPSFQFYHYDDPKGVTLLFERVVEQRIIPPDRWRADLAFLDLGIDGLSIRHEAYVTTDAKGAVTATYPAREGALPPSEVFVMGFTTRDDFINRLSSQLKAFYKLPRITTPDMAVWDKSKTRVEQLGFETFLSRGGGYPVVGLNRMNDLGAAPWKDRRLAARHVADEIVRRQLDDGRFFSRYEARFGRFSYHQIDVSDEALACLTLCDLAAVSDAADRERYLAAAARGINHIKTFFRTQKTAADEPFVFIVQNEEAALGPAALTVLALDRYASLTASVFFDGDMKLLGKFLITQQDDDGSFRHYFRYDAKVPLRYRLTHSFPGQATWALAVLDKRFGGDAWRRAARKGADYLTTKREEDMHWPEAPSDPWLAAALHELSTPIADVPCYVNYARRMADLAVKRQKIAGAPDLVGSFTGELEEGSVPAAALAMRLLGEAAAFTSPAADERGALLGAMRLSEQFIRLNEIRPNNAFFLPVPERGYGLIRNSTFDCDARLDSLCYAVEALLWLDRVEAAK